jgi:hypothetical protein
MTFKEKTHERRAAPGPRFEEIDTLYQKMVRDWAEDPEQIPMGDFTGVFGRLIDALKEAHDQNAAKKALEAKEAARAESLKKATQAKSRPKISTSEVQRGVLDELIGNLHKGVIKENSSESRITPMRK